MAKKRKKAAKATPKGTRAKKTNGAFPLTAKVRVLVDKNPKRPGSAAAKRFSKYHTGMTVEEALGAGIRWRDIEWDVAHEFTKIS